MCEYVIKRIEEEKLIAIVRGVKREHLIPLVNAIYAGGVRLVECTYDAKGIVPDEETAENIRLLSQNFEGKMLVGAGTVLSEKQVELTKKAGGKFIISPDTNEAVIRKTKELELVSMPGAVTPTEIASAHRYGADFVKVFPVNFIGGAQYIKAIKAPLSHIKLLAVSGVNPENMKEYLDAGVSGFGIGSGIVDKKLVEAGKFEEITKIAKKYADGVK